MILATIFWVAYSAPDIIFSVYWILTMTPEMIILWVKKSRLRAVKTLVPGHTDGQNIWT